MKGSDYVAEIGWIKTYRKIQECWIWLDKEPFDKRSAWIDLLLTANHSDKKILFNGELITVQRGQILTSVRKLSTKWKWSYDKTLRFLKLIESDGMVQRDSDNLRTLLTIVNYEVYQDVPITNRTPISEQASEQSSERTSERTSARTSDKQEYKELKNDKNVKNERKNNKVAKAPEIHYPNDEKLNQAFKDFMEMRKKIKKPMTDRAVTLAMNKLKELSTLPFSDTMDNDLAIQILEQSTMNCWQSLYPLKDVNSNQNQQKESKWLNDWRNA